MSQLAHGGQAQALEKVFREEDVYLGLATTPIGAEDSIDNFTEESTGGLDDDGRGYERQPIGFNQVESGNGVSYITNAEQVEFGPWGEDESGDISYAFIATEKEDGELLAFFELNETKEAATGEVLTLPAEQLVLELE